MDDPEEHSDHENKESSTDYQGGSVAQVAVLSREEILSDEDDESTEITEECCKQTASSEEEYYVENQLQKTNQSDKELKDGYDLNNSNISDEDKLIQKLCQELRERYHDIENVWAGYRAKSNCDLDGEENLVFVVYTKKETRNIPQTWKGYEIYKRDINRISDEAKLVENTIIPKKKFTISPEQQKALKETINKNAEQLLREHTNITIITTSPVKSIRAGKEFTRRDCIVIYCRVKGIIPWGEKLFPTYIGEFEVDVREGYYTVGGLTNDELPTSGEFHSSLKIGAEISVHGTNKRGTVGFFVNLPDGETGFVTCAHLAVDNDKLKYNIQQCTNIDEKVNDDIIVYQPGDNVNVIGHLNQVAFHCNKPVETSVDAALIKITKLRRNPTDGYMTNDSEEKLRLAGFSADNPPCFSTGKINKSPYGGAQVFKCGASTGITTGQLRADGALVRRENIDMSFEPQRGYRYTYTMHNQYEIHSLKTQEFFKNGDSGSLVMIKECGILVAIGMAIGCTSHDSCIVTPIDAVLQSLNIKCPLKRFIQQRAKRRKHQDSDSDIGNEDQIRETVFTSSSEEGIDSRPCSVSSGARPKTGSTPVANREKGRHQNVTQKRDTKIKPHSYHGSRQVQTPPKGKFAASVPASTKQNTPIQGYRHAASDTQLSKKQSTDITFKNVSRVGKDSALFKRSSSESSMLSTSSIKSPTIEVTTPEGYVIRGTKDANITVTQSTVEIGKNKEQVEFDSTEETIDAQFEKMKLDNEDEI